MAAESETDNGDYLGYGVYAQTLWNRAQAALNKDLAHREACLLDGKEPPPLGEDPLVIGIFGEWGAGKSKLLSLVQSLAEKQRDQQVRQHQLDGYRAITVPVFFQPWKYEHEKHLLVPLLQHILLDLEKTLASARNADDKATGAAQTVVQGARSVLGQAVKKVGDLTQSVGKVFGVAEPVAAEPVAAMAQAMAQGASDLLTGKAKRRAAREFSNADNGRSYYEMHRILSDVTRPAKNPHVTGDQHHDKDFCINFVIFIDDLDRCLPEKAVETLELIKTVFNLESFAFVLALDEEVVERGIGHRYKDYALVNKKPEMPITGFEYLEKIVHLPFRLPGLTPKRALQFLQQYEKEHVLSAPTKEKYNPQAWMCERTFELQRSEPITRGNAAEHGVDGKPGHPLQRSEAVFLNLAVLVVNSFDAHVPRKLVRVVELFHQTLAVLSHRGRLDQVVPGGLIDPRLLMGFVLLQLFQPDLYRACRRSLTGFKVLLDAMKEPEKAMLDSRSSAKALGKRTSDADLWHWAVGWVGDKPPVSERAALLRVPELQPVERHEAQRIQLPLASRLVEHRATQRHLFDAMRLFEQLRPLLDEPGARPIQSGVYFGVLALAEDSGFAEDMEGVILRREEATREGDQTDALTDMDTRADKAATPEVAPAPARGSSILLDLDELHAILVSGQESERDRLFQTLNLSVGETLPPEVEEALLSRLEAEQKQVESTNAKELSLWRSRVLDGLHRLAPHCNRLSHGVRWWALVSTLGDTDAPTGPFKSKAALQARARWMDVQAVLGQDGRFDRERFYLPRQRLANNERNTEREPIPGFVRVFENKRENFQLFKGPLVTLEPYYIARYLTTVDQYACFFKAGGYGDPNGEKPIWWDPLGWLWRTGQWDSQVKEEPYRQLLARRKTELRGAPMGWAEQQAYGSRPVMNVNWFEARAYARWLNQQLQELQDKGELDRLPAGYAVRLPTEGQWERAARARDLSTAGDSPYPWNSDKLNTVHLRANIRGSGIDRVSPVGLFASSPLGLFDLSGNVWEWQDNLHTKNGEGQHKGLDHDVAQLKTHEDPDQCDRPALRGGAWFDTADGARASVRGRYRPDYWYYFVGFRVVLSLAQMTSDT